MVSLFGSNTTKQIQKQEHNYDTEIISDTRSKVEITQNGKVNIIKNVTITSRGGDVSNNVTNGNNTSGEKNEGKTSSKSDLKLDTWY